MQARIAIVAGASCVGAYAVSRLLSTKRIQKSVKGDTQLRGEGRNTPLGPLPVVVTGPSGAGKGTLIAALLAAAPNQVGFCISHTTRAPRPGETDGVEYHFVSHEEMEGLIEANKFIEYAHVHTNIYGTSIQSLRDVQEAGKICIMDIDVQGARSIRANKNVDARFVFISPPSMEALEARLRGRGTETEEKVLVRLGNAIGEMKSKDEPGLWDQVVVNGNLATAKRDFVDVVLNP